MEGIKDIFVHKIIIVAENPIDNFLRHHLKGKKDSISQRSSQLS